MFNFCPIVISMISLYKINFVLRWVNFFVKTFFLYRHSICHYEWPNNSQFGIFSPGYYVVNTQSWTVKTVYIQKCIFTQCDKKGHWATKSFHFDIECPGQLWITCLGGVVMLESFFNKGKFPLSDWLDSLLCCFPFGSSFLRLERWFPCQTNPFFVK